jgi:WhiB family redox-sensing transcriptional regulator
MHRASNKPAKQICMGCDVRARCLKYALESNQQFGVWGGTSERERRRIKREAGPGEVAA